MKRIPTIILLMGLLFFYAIPVGISHAIIVQYEATDVADMVAGEDLWQYTYTVSDAGFLADTGFTIYYDVALYGALEPFPLSPNPDWDVLTWDPDTSLPDDGAYDAYALVDNASLADPFTVEFVWLGSGTPGAQYFELYGTDFSTLDSGATTPAQGAPVPEPCTLLFLGAGLVGLAGFGQKRSADP